MRGALCLLVIFSMATAPVAGEPAAAAQAAAVPAVATNVAPNPGPLPQATQNELASLCRALREKDSPSNYLRLTAFEREHANDSAGPLAAFALGYRDYTHGHSADAAAWLRRAEKGGVIQDYVLYWEAQNEQVQHHSPAAVDLLERVLREYPGSAVLPQALEALAGISLELRDAPRARFALEGFAKTAEHPTLLLLRARARELDRAPGLAAADYVALYYRFPLTAEAKRAGDRLEAMRKELRGEFPEITPQMRFARAQAFYDARQWKPARAEYQSIAKASSGEDRERALLRAAASEIQPKGGPGALEKLRLANANLDAERYALLADVYHRKKKIEAMQRAGEAAVARAPHSEGAAAALFESGNYFWSHLDQRNAADYYRRSLEASGTSAVAETAKWRLAWTAYLDRDAHAATIFEEHVRQFPTSSYLPEALYWLGRLAERAGDAPVARAYLLKLAGRFPQTYWGSVARNRLKELGPGNAAPAESVPVLALVRPPKPLPDLAAPLPAAAAARDTRARALYAIGFDASADMEWRAGFAETGASGLLVALAQAAVAEGRYPAAIVTIRQAIPQLEARRWEELPVSVWAAAFPLPYAEQIRSAAARQGLDPMLVAGLIRQESAFQPGSLSKAKAMGLMQVMPGTGKILARQLNIPFKKSRLFEPGYNLQLGTKFLANLVAMFGAEEPAIAAYDAGENRIANWQAQRKYEEMAEFIESIPITETREYVQIVSRNATIYRRLGAARP
ncbi:MAG TPA: transglycosylase SLT domain-containing protein [Candidatus Acidoferrales bacterium]|nr:transglycosylase SLT domain-containing protein [Candidatus Acidoferrales bacterium]